MAVAERVQALASSKIHELPARFVRPVHEQPAKSKAIEGVTVPVISLSGPAHTEVVDQVRRACCEWGFFVVTDHGIPGTLIDRVKEVGIEFFELPQAEKEKLANDHSGGNFEGYGTKMTKNHEEKVEWIDYYFHIISPPSKVRLDKWPHKPSSYREMTEEYDLEIRRVTEEVLELMSEGLGLGKNVLRERLGGEDMELEMKINFYPPCPQPELALGVEPHTDMSALTILVPNDVPGLQVHKDCQWVAVDYVQIGLLVHVGDQAEVLSNGKYKGVLHRSLVNKERTRMSWAVSCVPPKETVIGPLQELVDEQNPPKYTARAYAEFQYRKFNKLPLA